LTLGLVFGRRLRQTEGQLVSALKLVGLLDLAVPDRTTLSQRARKRDVDDAAPAISRHYPPELLPKLSRGNEVQLERHVANSLVVRGREPPAMLRRTSTLPAMSIASATFIAASG